MTGPSGPADQSRLALALDMNNRVALGLVRAVTCPCRRRMKPELLSLYWMQLETTAAPCAHTTPVLSVQGHVHYMHMEPGQCQCACSILTSGKLAALPMLRPVFNGRRFGILREWARPRPAKARGIWVYPAVFGGTQDAYPCPTRPRGTLIWLTNAHTPMPDVHIRGLLIADAPGAAIPGHPLKRLRVRAKARASDTHLHLYA